MGRGWVCLVIDVRGFMEGVFLVRLFSGFRIV